MNTDTGEIYELGTDDLLIDPTETPLRSLAERVEALKRPATRDEIAAAVDDARGDTIVPVSDAVAQTMRVGQAELARRRRRRRRTGGVAGS